MNKKDFIDCISSAIESSFSQEGRSFFLCLSLDSESENASDFFKEIFSPDESDAIFTLGYKNGHDDVLLSKQEIETRRVFAIQVFEQICLDSKMYLKF